ncbi:MAG TPA: hypothetical protein VEC94_01030 [Pseudolabrys sp.]|nr:hypothetical protein [Pseudolabrys sp.]
MPERKSTLAYAMLALVLVAGIFVQSTRTVRAADECLSKPNSPAPQGQHWYYRVDHVNNRQCWRLGPEGLLVRKSAPQVETPAAPPRAERPTATPPTNGVETADVDVAATAAPVLWLDGSKLLNLPPSLQPSPQTGPGAEPQFAGTVEPAPPVSNNVSDSTSRDGSPASVRAEKSQGTTARSLHATAPAQTEAEGDHAFPLPLVVIMFASLAVAGTAINYTKRRHKRKVNTFQPPRWASTVDLNTPVSRAPLARGREIAPALATLTAPDQTEKLRYALQQVVDQLQTIQRPWSEDVKYSASAKRLNSRSGQRLAAGS